MKSRCQELLRRCEDSRQKRWHCYSSAEPKPPQRLPAKALLSLLPQKPPGLLFWSVCLAEELFGCVWCGWCCSISGRHRTHPMSPLFVFSGEEIRLHGPLGAMGHSIGGQISTAWGPLPLIDVGWTYSQPFRRHLELCGQQDTHSGFPDGWTHPAHAGDSLWGHRRLWATEERFCLLQTNCLFLAADLLNKLPNREFIGRSVRERWCRSAWVRSVWDLELTLLWTCSAPTHLNRNSREWRNSGNAQRTSETTPLPRLQFLFPTEDTF